MASPLSASVAREGDAARIVLVGRVDRDGDEAMASAYEEVRTLGASSVVLDFSDADYINSTGIALIVRLLAEARRDGRAVRAKGLTEHYREIFRITRLSDFIALDDEGATTTLH